MVLAQVIALLKTVVFNETGVKGGDDEQGKERGDRQAADDRDSQGLPGDGRQCDRDDADDSAKRGDEDRFKPGLPRIGDSILEENLHDPL